MTTPSPLSPDGAFVTFSIATAGVEIPATFQVSDISVSHETGKPAKAEITLYDGDAATQVFPVSDSNTFTPGKTIRISAGHQNVNAEIFSGVITGQALLITQADASKVIIVCEGTVDKTTPAGPPVLTVEYGDSILTFNAEKTGRTKMNGNVSFQGSALAKPGSFIQLAGLGARFNGDYPMYKTINEISNGQWLTTAYFGEPG